MNETTRIGDKDIQRIEDELAAARRLKEAEQEERYRSEIDKLNEQYAVVREGGRTRVHYFETDGERRISQFLSFQDFRNFHLNQTIAVGKTNLPLGDWWLRHPDRRQYDGLIFEPNGKDVIGGKLNLWQGYAITPTEGCWDLMKRHIREVLCDNDEAGDEYVLNWLAWMFQHPDERAEVALVFKGTRGSGKGTLGNAVCRIFGPHAFHVQNTGQFAGRFNAHLRDCCFLFADESYWGGDKSAEGTLQGLITEPQLPIEGKGVNLVMVRNTLHIIQASNNDWAIPAGAKERRFVVFETCNRHASDEDWFVPLYEELHNNGGLGAMLYDLLHRDIADFHPRQIYRTKALAEQQRRSLSPEDSAWVEILEAGILGGACNPTAPNEAISNDYDTINDNGHAVKHKGLYTVLRENSPALRHRTDRHLADFLTKQGGCDADGKPLVRRVKIGASRRRGWSFPPLSVCRNLWKQEHPEWDFSNDEVAWQTEWADAMTTTAEEETMTQRNLSDGAVESLKEKFAQFH